MKSIRLSALDDSPRASLVVTDATYLRLETGTDVMVAKLDETGKLALMGWLTSDNDLSAIQRIFPERAEQIWHAMRERE